MRRPSGSTRRRARLVRKLSELEGERMVARALRAWLDAPPASCRRSSARQLGVRQANGEAYTFHRLLEVEAADDDEALSLAFGCLARGFWLRDG